MKFSKRSNLTRLLTLLLSTVAPMSRGVAENAGKVGAVNQDATGTPPGGTSSLHFDSRGFTPLFRNRSVPSRRDSLHFGPVYFAITNLFGLRRA